MAHLLQPAWYDNFTEAARFHDRLATDHFFV
jgi:hypothetical protein